MNAGILRKTVREVWPLTAVSGVAVALIVAVLAYVLPTFQDEVVGQLWQIDFVRTIVRATLGAEIGDQLGPELAGAFAWSHPIVIAVVVAHGVFVCSRVPAGEVDRGTVDFLLSLPVSRWQVHRTEGVVWVASSLVIVACALGGHALGGSLAGAAPPPMGWQRMPIAANLLALSLTFGALTWWIAALVDRRGRVMAFALGIVIPSFLLNYLRQFWAPAELLSVASPLRYYQPFAVMRDGGWPWSDLAILLTAALVSWSAAGVTFARRDLCTT